MTASPLHSHAMRGGSWALGHTDADVLRSMAIAAGIGWSIAFVVIGLAYELQAYGDGSMFCYAVAVRDAWAFHWHNISGRVAVFLLTLLPAEIYVALTGDPGGGIFVYGLLFFAAPLVGLAATFAADRSKGRIIFVYACFSTAFLSPLVFGFPTEMWVAHALFWPTLAAAHDARRSILRTGLLFLLMLALVLTHEGAVVLAAAIVATLALRGVTDRLFLRAAAVLLVALAIWGAVKAILPPDDYFAAVYVRAALDFFDLGLLRSGLVLLLSGTVTGYAITFVIFARFAPAKAHIYAAAIVALGLIVYWLRFDHALHADNRYYMRTAFVVVTPLLGGLAALFALRADGRFRLPLPARVLPALASPMAARAIAGAFVLVMLVHAVETAKFVSAWTNYKAAVLALATGTASDPALGDPRFVSSARIGADLNRLSWYSTTPYLSVILAGFAPKRLVVDPRVANYFWLSCATASANAEAKRAVPAQSRELARIYACLHRR
jgi:hypothetical protein